MSYLLTQKPVLLLLGALLLFGGWEIYGRVSEQTRLTPAVYQALGSGEMLDLTVALPFAPEQFHIKLLQRYGTVSAVQSNSVTVRRVPPDKVLELGKSYWITRIDLEGASS